MYVDRICSKDVDLAEPDESAWVAAERMHQRAVGTLVVKDKSNHPIGILTDRDLVERVLAPDRDPHTTLVQEIMTSHPIRIRDNASIHGAVALMRSGEFRRLPVVDANDRLVGLISLDDILMHWCDEFADIGYLLRKETPRAVAECV